MRTVMIGGVVGSGFCEGRGVLFAPCAAYFAMYDLINREWKTKTTAKASGGKVAFRGFKGRYRLSWKDAEGKGRSKFVEVE